MGNVSPRHTKSYHEGLNRHFALSTTTSITTTTTSTTSGNSIGAAATPNRSSWKKQLQIINDTLNIKKFSLRHGHGKPKRYRTGADENTRPTLSTSATTQNFHEFMKATSSKANKEYIPKKLNDENLDRPMKFKKSFSLFSIKQPLNNSTNKETTLVSAISTATNMIEERIKEEEEEGAAAAATAPKPSLLPPAQQRSASNSTANQPSTIVSDKQQLSTKENQTTDAAMQQKRRENFAKTTAFNTLVNKRHSAFVLPSYHLPKSQSQYYHHQHHHHQHVQLSSSGKGHNGLSASTKHIRAIEKTTTRKTIIQASTSELLRCLGEYLCSSCAHLLPILDPIDCILWIKGADRQLVLQGWQEQVFVNPANIVFVYLLVRETLTYVVPSITIKSVTELHAIILTCLYLAFSYMGNEITYPLKPFVTDDETRDAFWQRVVLIMGQLSSKMLAINQNPKFFTECFSELKTYNLVH